MRVHRFHQLPVCAVRGLILATLPALVVCSVYSSRAGATPVGQATTLTLAVPGARIRVQTEPGAFVRPWSVFRHWIAHAANVVGAYYGRFPVTELHLSIVPVDGRGVKTGNATALDKPRINVAVGRNSDVSDFEADWILVHEMIHLAFPSVAKRHHWIEEGLATYVESVARAQRGDLAAEFVWRGFVKGMPKGLPGPGDAGLDHTRTWGRTYWGGALFCLLADVAIREQTSGRYGLQHALRAIVAAGLSIQDQMLLAEVLRLGDQVTGVRVLTDLYLQMAKAPGRVDLPTLWEQLGVSVHDGVAVFDEAAPLAHIRRQITAPMP